MGAQPSGPTAAGVNGGAPPGWPWPDGILLILVALAVAAFAVRQAAARGWLALPAGVFPRGGEPPGLAEMEARAVYRSAVPPPVEEPPVPPEPAGSDQPPEPDPHR